MVAGRERDLLLRSVLEGSESGCQYLGDPLVHAHEDALEPAAMASGIRTPHTAHRNQHTPARDAA